MDRMRVLLSFLALAGLLVGLLPGVLGAQEVTSATQMPGNTVVVRFHYESRDRLDAVAGQLDIWEVHLDQGYAVAAVTPAEYGWLQSLGYPLEIDRELTALLSERHEPFPGQGPDTIPGYPCYRTVEETYADMQALATSYPSLVDFYDIGDSWDKVAAGGPEGYDIYALRLTNEAITPIATKPTFFLMAEIHAREYTTAETAMRFAEYLLQNYGSNAEITFFLDYYRLYVVPMTNPDGRKMAEGGQLWRKNTDSDDGCNTPSSWGTDLNRNSSFKWGCCGGSSGSPCAETYRGPSAASEPETQAVQNLVLSLFPDQRGPGDTDPAPLDATGVLITLHSYSQLVLWPWGWTGADAPNGPQLQTLGRKLAYYNNYTPQQSNDLYTTDGTTDDWSYGELGIASYTFEMGTQFFQSCTTFENTIWPNNRPALLYALTVADTPYMTSYGPDALSAAADPPAVPYGQPVQLTATIDDTRRRYDPAQNITAAEYFILPLHGNTPPGDPGSGTPMSPADGNWNSSIEGVVATIDTSALSPGDYIVALRGKDAGDNWGPFTAAFLSVTGCENVAIEDVTTAANGCVVTFLPNLAGSPPFTYAWDFGPFGTSPESNPIVDFGLSGTYTYALTVTNCITGSDGYAGEVTVYCCTEPYDAAFEYSPSDPLIGESVIFTGTAGGTLPLTFTWDFGDGSRGSGAHVSHAYSAGGDYTVWMTASNECGDQSVSHVVSVCRPAANLSFWWSPVTPTVNTWVAFHGSAQGSSPIAYAWDFGDGGTGSGANVSHRYTSAGLYTVRMTATNCGGAASTVEHSVMIIPPGCDTPVDITAVETTVDGCQVTFDSTVTGDAPIKYLWDFGDGGTSAEADPVHLYGQSGAYSVTLDAWNCSQFHDHYALNVQVDCAASPQWSVYLPLIYRGY